MRDLAEQAEGFRWRERQALERHAWLASVLLQAWVPNAPSPHELLTPVVSDAEAAMESLVSKADPLAALDAAYARQAQMRRN